jgi:two-component system response regulator PilR (NtrC family)
LLECSKLTAPQRILLVEDDDDVSELFTVALREEGYIVDLARTVAMAWAHLDARSYALAIVDWKLPDGDGTSIAAAAAQLGAKTFLVSGYLSQMAGGREQGHVNIMKPILPSKLVQAVRQTIGGPASRPG